LRRFVPPIKSLWCDEAVVNDVPLLENFADCCLADTFGLVRDSLGELCGEYVDWGDGEEDASIPVVPWTKIFRKK
jgi:hypothetical protein